MIDLLQVPSHWKVGTLREYIELETGRRMKGGGKERGDVASIGGEHINAQGGFAFTNLKYISKDFFDSLSKGKIRSNDVLMVKDGATTGKLAYAADLAFKEAAINEHVFLLRSTDASNLINEFLFYFLRSRRGQSQIRRAFHGLIGGVKREDVLSISLPLPSIEEQKAITFVLKAIKHKAHVVQSELELQQQLKVALMQHLFAYGTKAQKTKQTETGAIPESWRVVRLGDVAIVERGKFTHRPRNDPAYYGGNVPFVQTADVTAANGHIKTYTQTLNEKGLSVSRVFPKGTIVITIAANIGYTGVLEFDSAFPDSLIAVTPHAHVDTDFLNYYLSTQQSEMDKKAPRGTQKNINIEFLLPWPIILPPFEVQREIAAILRTSDLLIAVLEKEESLLVEVFQSMLEALMTGRLSAKPLIGVAT